MSDVPADSHKQLHFDNGIIVRMEKHAGFHHTQFVLSGTWAQYLALDANMNLVTGPAGIDSFYHYGTLNSQTGAFTFPVWNYFVNDKLYYLSQLC